MSSFAIIAAFILFALKGPEASGDPHAGFFGETSLLQTSASMRSQHNVHRLDGTMSENRMPTLCVRPGDLHEASLKATSNLLSAGMPAWPYKAPVQSPDSPDDMVMAFLIQVSYQDYMPLLRRTFDRLYSPKDVFLYLVDEKKLDMATVKRALPHPLPSNVHFRTALHAQYYVWPRVEVVLQGMETLLGYPWDIVVHLSESDYPVHSVEYIRRNFAAQRGTNFIQMIPRCSRSRSGPSSAKDDWFWWKISESLATCGSHFVEHNEEVHFPMAQLEGVGFRFAHGAEWVAVTRELVQYALSPALRDYRALVGTHFGADEIFWQSMVLNIPGFSQRVSQQGWFIRWGHGKTDHSPDTLTEDYKHEILSDSGSYLFARKVSSADSARLLDEFDAFAAWETSQEASAPVIASNSAAWDQEAISCTTEMGVASSVGWTGTKSVKQLQERSKLFMMDPEQKP